MDSSSSKNKGTTQARDSFDAAMGLPKTYGDTKIVILPRDPLWFYAYWEVATETYAKLRPLVLRILNIPNFLYLNTFLDYIRKKTALQEKLMRKKIIIESIDAPGVILIPTG